MTGGSSHVINLKGGSNTIKTTTAKTVTINLNSSAEDNITMEWGNNRGLYTINAGKNSSIAMEDTLTITQAKRDSFNFSYEKTGNGSTSIGVNLLLTSTTDSSSKILITNWMHGKAFSSFDQSTSFDCIKFADGKMSYADINAKANINF